MVLHCHLQQRLVLRLGFPNVHRLSGAPNPAEVNIGPTHGHTDISITSSLPHMICPALPSSAQLCPALAGGNLRLQLPRLD